MVIAALAFYGLPIPLAIYRDQGILRRLSTTPVPPAWVLAAQLILNVSFAVAELIILLVVAMTGFGVARRRTRRAGAGPVCVDGRGVCHRAVGVCHRPAGEPPGYWPRCASSR